MVQSSCVRYEGDRRMEEEATYYTGGLKLHLTEDFR